MTRQTESKIPGECPECGAFEWEDNGCEETDLDFTILCPVCGFQHSPNM